ncbi:hypothetical protein ACFLRO_00755 [Bacteroidota bacterium]
MSNVRGQIQIGMLAILALVGPLSRILPAQGLDAPVRGMIWTPPDTFSEMRNELEMMSSAGIQAVRIDLVLDENVYVLSDMFGIALYQEIDLGFSPAVIESGRIEEFAADIDSALDMGSRFGGGRYLGLGYWNDTSDERMCAALSTLADAARANHSQVSIYYITPFVDDDRCSDVVDFVLLDSKNLRNPVDMVERWRNNHDTPVGIAALGVPVFNRAGRGYLSSDTPEAQARYLETMLTELMGDQRLVAVFVDRWIERVPQRLNAVGIDGDFGILEPDSSPRPAMKVVEGFYTGRQRVFAFSTGNPVSSDYSWLNLVAFVAAALFGFGYYSSLGLRSLLRRYFLSHSFYLEKVGDGRDATIGTSLFLLACLSFAASIVGMALVAQLRSTSLWFVLMAWAPKAVSWGFRAGVRYQSLLIPTFSGLFALVTLLWALGLSSLTRGKKRLGFAQTLQLAIMPRWPVAIIGLLVLVVINWQIEAPLIIMAVGTAVWLSVVTVFTGRMFSDYLRLLGITALLTIPVLLLALAVVAATGWLVIVTNDIVPELTFLWNLATKS